MCECQGEFKSSPALSSYRKSRYADYHHHHHHHHNGYYTLGFIIIFFHPMSQKKLDSQALAALRNVGHTGPATLFYRSFHRFYSMVQVMYVGGHGHQRFERRLLRSRASIEFSSDIFLWGMNCCCCCVPCESACLPACLSVRRVHTPP